MVFQKGIISVSLSKIHLVELNGQTRTNHSHPWSLLFAFLFHFQHTFNGRVFFFVDHLNFPQLSLFFLVDKAIYFGLYLVFFSSVIGHLSIYFPD